MYFTNSQAIPTYHSSSMPVSMNSHASNSMPVYSNSQGSSDDRIFAGGFLGPFVLGGITGGLLAPAFYPRPYPMRPYPMRPYPYYGPYYR